MKTQYEGVCRKHPEFRDYFPDYEKDYAPQRKFFWSIYLTLFWDEAEETIDAARLRKLGSVNEDDLNITIHPSFLTQLREYHSKPRKIS